MKFTGAVAAAMLTVTSWAIPALAQETGDTTQMMTEKLKVQEGQMLSYLNSSISLAAQVRVLTAENVALKKKLAETETKPEAKPEPPKETAPAK